MKKIGVLVCGLGFIATTEHIPALKRMPEVELVGVVSSSRERSRSIAEKFKVKRWYTDYDKALEDPEVEVVDITSPTFRHKEQVLKAVEANKHVIVEKPIALRLSDAKEMTEKAKKRDVKFMVAHCLRFWPEYVRVKEMLDEGVIGEPRIARAYRLSSYPMWSWKLWHKHIELSGGVAVDLMIHDIDFLRWTLGEVDEVFARGGIYLFKDATAHDFMHALLKFKRGAIAYVEGSWIMPKEFPFTTYLEVAGTKGLLVVDNQTTATLRLFRRGVQEVLTPVAENAYYLELKHFIECIREDKEPSISGEEATRSLEVALACIKSVRENRPIKLPLTEEVI